MSNWTTAAPAAVSALVAMAQTVIDPHAVHHHTAVTASGSREAIVVAGSADRDAHPDRQYIEHKFPPPGYTSDQEGLFTIYSEIAVLKGSADAVSAVARAYAILDGWGQALADDPTLGDVVLQAWVAEVGCRVQQTGGGALAVLLVAIDCQAFTGP